MKYIHQHAKNNEQKEKERKVEEEGDGETEFSCPKLGGFQKEKRKNTMKRAIGTKNDSIYDFNN